jgi:hypothetical protein
MRHGLGFRLGLTAALAAALFAGGCAGSGSVDGDLTNGWAAMAAATGFEPTTGTCHSANFTPVGARSTYEEIDCSLQHRGETVFVGSYDAPAADAETPPEDGSAGARAVYDLCDQRTTEYLGGPWRDARLWIGVTHPTESAWSGGARWYRCEVLELSSIEDDGGVVQRSGSLRGVLADANADLQLGCYAVQQDSGGAISTMPAVACTAKHNAEFVGVWFAKDLDYPSDDASWAKFHDGCRALIATYAKVPNDGDLQFRTGVVSLPGGKDVWEQGDRGVRCYLWLDGASLTASVKDKGDTGLPIQYK